MPEMTKAPSRFGPPSRGVSARDVELAADALLRAGERPTIEKVREKLGTGSPNTINPLLDAWWRRLSARLDSGPAALHRLPESVAHAAEALWMQALDEGRRRAAQEQHATTRALATDKQTLDVRSHVLSLREGELESRLRDREQRQATLEAQLRDLTTLLRKEQATREAQTRRIADLEQQLLVRTPPLASKPSRSRFQRRSNAPPRPRPPHRQKAQRAVASPSGRAVRATPRHPWLVRPARPSVADRSVGSTRLPISSQRHPPSPSKRKAVKTRKTSAHRKVKPRRHR